MKDIILLKQGEVVLKGLNKRYFEQKLLTNMKVFAGAVDPLGREIVRCPADTEAVETFTFDTEVLAKARSTRRHLQDFRSDIDWFRQSF